jgi:hypothetical protein
LLFPAKGGKNLQKNKAKSGKELHFNNKRSHNAMRPESREKNISVVLPVPLQK